MTIVQHKQKIEEITNEMHAIIHKTNVIENTLAEHENYLQVVSITGDTTAIPEIKAAIAQCKQDINKLCNKHDLLEHEKNKLATDKIPEANRELLNLQRLVRQLPQSAPQTLHIPTAQRPTANNDKPADGQTHDHKPH